MASSNVTPKDKAIKSLIDDVFKDFKASGDFDRLRKEYFVEITSLNSFQNLTKNVDEYIQKLLEEQLRIHHHPSALKKNDLREIVRRRLHENYSFNHQMTSCMNQIIDAKIEPNLKPIINSMVDKLTKNIESTSSVDTGTGGSTGVDVQPTTNEPAISKTVSGTPSTPQLQQRKVSIEDFLCISDPKSISVSSNLSKIPKLGGDRPKTGDIERQKSKDDVITPKKDEPKKEKITNIEEKKTVQVKTEPKSTSETVKPSSSQTAKPQTPTSKKPPQSQPSSSVAASSYEFMRKLSFVNEAKLQPDPSKKFNFDWKLDQIPDDFIENISVSSVDSSDLGTDSSNSTQDEDNDNDKPNQDDYKAP